MNPQLRAWLDTKVTVRRNFSALPSTLSRVERLAELIAVNAGSIRPMSWGVIGGGDGPYGRSGLEQEEAFELMQWEGFFAALEMVDPISSRELEQEIEDIWKRNLAEYRAKVEAKS